MDIFEQREVLRSFEILVDTREQDTDRARERYERMGVPVFRAKLNFGDYTYNATLPDGTKLFDTETPINPLCSVERKMSLDELAMCIGKDRKRFQREFERAKEAGARVILLCENASWENLINGRYRSKLNPNAYLGSLVAWAERYDFQLLFCKEETSGRLIKEYLYRDLKERLERGEFG
jgi:ERCC4-type nuclease